MLARAGRTLMAAAVATVAFGVLAPSAALAAPQAPSVFTERATSVAETGATLNATVDPNEAEVTECKFEYGTSISYGKSASCSSLPGSGDNEVGVSATVEGLTESTIYHYRIVAKNSEGTSFGTDRRFTTLPNTPTVFTGSASSVTETGANLNAVVNPNDENVTECKFEYGTSLSYGNTASCSSLPGSGDNEVGVSAPVTSLAPSTTYHFRIVATNELGTSYGSDRTFTTLPNAPTVVTEKASSVGKTSATLNGLVNPHGTNVTECKFEYGTSQSYGSTMPCSSLPGSGQKPVEVSASVGSLAEGTTYHFRIVATNTLGGTFGADRTFKTLPHDPTVVTERASSVTKTEATLNGRVNPNDAEVTECKFEYGTSLAYGSSVSCTTLPGAGESPVEVSAPVGALTENTTYHFRLVATNARGTTFGVDRTLTTLPRPPRAVTEAASAVGATSATLNATVNPNDSNVTECKFEYGENIGYGSSVPCSALPGSGDKGVDVSAGVMGLTPETTYHFRIVAMNALGTTYGGDAKFTTRLPGQAPKVKKVSPRKGTTAGGTAVTIHGVDFEGATSVMFGSTEATSFTVNSSTSIVAVSPAHAAEAVNITVTTPNGTSEITTKDRFVYKAPR